MMTRAGAEWGVRGSWVDSGRGACPDLLQRRSGPGLTARRSAEYQRFSSDAPARSGPLQQIRTTCAAADPREGLSPACSAATSTVRRRGPTGGPPRVGRRPRRAPLAPRGALRTRKCSSNRRSRGQNARLECKMHISTGKKPVAVAADRDADPAAERLCSRSGHAPAPSRPRSSARTTLYPPIPITAPIRTHGPSRPTRKAR